MELITLINARVVAIISLATVIEEEMKKAKDKKNKDATPLPGTNQ